MPHYQAPDSSLHFIDEQFEYMLPAGSVEITDERAAEIVIEKTQVDPNNGPVPLVVTRFQARAALLITPGGEGFDNLLAEVDAVMNHQDTDPLARLAWTDAQEFKRNSPTILSIAPLLALTDDDLDNLFITAAGIDA